MKSNIFEVRKEILNSLGGNSTGLSSVYEVDLQILGVLSKGVGGGSSIDDSVVATDKTWSSKKIMDTVGVGFNVSVVDELPETGDEHTIYLVSKSGTDTDVYNEYLYVNGAYEKIGSTDIDLTNYVLDAPWDGKQYVRQDGAWVEASSGDSGDSDGFSVISDELDYLTVCHDASSDGSTQVKVSFDNSVVTPDIKYSIWDNGVMTQDWTQWDYSELTVPSKNGAIKFKGTNTERFSNDSVNSGLFKITGPARLQGNIMSLIDEQIDGLSSLYYLERYCFSNLFKGNTSLISCSKNLLPAEIGNLYGYESKSSYIHMFEGCTSLIVAPELPAQKLNGECYMEMFKDCTSLTNAPKLPSTFLANSCYKSMFKGCTSLIEAPELPADFAPSYCYSNMFEGCTSLIEAPELNATTILEWCYYDMFYNCTSLKTAPELPATTLADGCYSNMFYNCTSLIKAPELPATTLADSCYSFMFGGCTSLIKAPELLADTLVNNCYSGMFRDCKQIDYIKCLSKNTGGIDYTRDWLDGVKSNGTFARAKGVYWYNEYGGTYVPRWWTIVDAELEVKSDDVYNIWSGTQEEYDAITDKSDTVLYLIKES